MHHGSIDGVAYQLLEPCDFSFLRKYGKVFQVFDEQSLNVCFGIENEGRKRFVKFAGTKPQNYFFCEQHGGTAMAIATLKNAVRTYQDLAHPSLITFLEAEEIGGGFAAVFEWTDAIGIEPLGSPDYLRFMNLPAEAKLRAFADIMAFHAHAAARGYVAIDFYDGSILYDYAAGKVVICDIDFYQKSPYVGEMGLWGSTRFVSPEECAPGAVMDEVTTVYTMGATAFSLFSGNRGNRDIESWQLSRALYDVAKRATSDERSERQQSIQELIEEWEAAT